MTTGGKLLKFTLQDQGNKQSKKSTSKFNHRYSSVEADSRPPQPLLLHETITVNGTPSLASVVSFTSPTPLDILTWNGSSCRQKNAGTIVCYCFFTFSRLMETLKKKRSKAHNLSEFGIFCVQIPGPFDIKGRRCEIPMSYCTCSKKCRLVTCYPSSWSAGHLAIFHIQKRPHGVTLNSRQIHFAHSSEGVTGSKCDANRLAAKVTLAKLFLDLLLWYSSIGHRHPSQDSHTFFKTLRKNRNWRDIIWIKLLCQWCPYLTTDQAKKTLNSREIPEIWNNVWFCSI